VAERQEQPFGRYQLSGVSTISQHENAAIFFNPDLTIFPKTSALLRSTFFDYIVMVLGELISRVRLVQEIPLLSWRSKYSTRRVICPEDGGRQEAG
jgi:hypothetical protein